MGDDTDAGLSELRETLYNLVLEAEREGAVALVLEHASRHGFQAGDQPWLAGL